MSKNDATQSVDVKAKNQRAIIRMGTDSNATHTFVLKTTGMCYTPFFINKGLLAFGITGKSKSNNLNKIQVEYPITTSKKEVAVTQSGGYFLCNLTCLN